MSNIYKILFSIALLLWAGISSAQSIQVNGTIQSKSEGKPIAGVSIVEKGTTNGTTSDKEGEFSLEVKENTVLKISDLGYKPQEINITRPVSNLIIHLEESIKALDELVVTALNISKEKKSLGYSVQELHSEDINKTKESNLVNALAGKVAGVRVTNSQGGMGSSRIVIRGETSISGNNQPLFIIDGIPVDNTQHLGSVGDGRNPERSRDFSNAIADLNPDDIASISVLKGPNAAALYGSRAAGGVVLIQTKDGRDTEGLGVTFNSNSTFSNLLTLPDYQNVFGQGTNGRFEYVDGEGGGINDAVDESWGPKMEGQLIPQFYSNGEPVPFVPHPNNVRDFFNTGYKLDNGVSFSQSKENYHFRFSFNNMNQHGVIPNTEQEKNSFSLKAGYDILPNLSLDVLANYIRRDAPNLPGAGGLRETSTMLQFAWFGRQVSIDKLYDLYKQGDPTNWNNLYYSNIYANTYNNTVSQERNRLIGSINLKYDITDKLSATFRTGNDYYTDKRKMRVAFGTKGVPYGSYGENIYAVHENNTSLDVNYTQDLNQDFNLDFMVGGNSRTNITEDNDQSAPRLAVPDVYTLSNSRVPLISENYYTQLKAYSLYSSAQVGFKNYAYLNLTARNDWSSSLPKEHQSYFYPSFNGSFILSEAFNLTNNQINLIKLRGGWSKVGKATSAYQLINTYAFTTPFGENPQLHANSTNFNADLRPEETTSVEAGFELGFFKNRIHFDASFYDMNSYNQILAVEISPSTGYQKKLINGGKINNKGFEATLGLAPIREKDFSWDLILNYSTNRSKLINLDKENSISSYTLGSVATVQTLAAKGLPYGALFGTTYLRNEEGQILVNSDGLPANNPDKQHLGKYTPSWMGSIDNNFAFRNIQLNFLVDASFGGSIYSRTNRTGSYTGVLASTLPGRSIEHGGISYYYPDNDRSQNALPLTSENKTTPGGENVYDDGMIFEGVYRNGEKNETIIPAESYYKALSNIDEVFTYDASYVKLREVKLGYTFETATTKWLQNATISVVGRNLWIIHKKAPNIDPETAFNTDNGGQGLEDLGLPSNRSFGININLKF